MKARSRRLNLLLTLLALEIITSPFVLMMRDGAPKTIVLCIVVVTVVLTSVVLFFIGLTDNTR